MKRLQRRSTAMTTTHVPETSEVNIADDVHRPLPAADERPPLFMIAKSMDASGFATLASHFPIARTLRDVVDGHN